MMLHLFAVYVQLADVHFCEPRGLGAGEMVKVMSPFSMKTKTIRAKDHEKYNKTRKNANTVKSWENCNLS